MAGFYAYLYQHTYPQTYPLLVNTSRIIEKYYIFISIIKDYDLTQKNP